MHHPGNSPASRDRAYMVHPYTNLKVHGDEGPVIITEGKGVHVYDDSGKEYIEAMAGLWSTALGFNEPRLAEAAMRQMKQLPYYHIFAHKSHNPGIDLAERLVDMAPGNMARAFFANSGSEANDTAIKLIWYYNNALGRPEKKKIISRVKAYHGVTIASASLTGLPANHRDFDLPIAGILHTDCPHHYRFAHEGESEEDFATRLAENLDKLIEDEGPETVAAFIAEPVMGAGGVIVPPRTYFEKIQKVLRKHDVLLVADEVINGFGRTGNAWGCETYGLEPDMVTVAKALSSSYLPISALLISEKIYDAMVLESEKIGTFGHGYTYSAHPVAAAVALEALDLYAERGIFDHVKAVAPRFLERLRSFEDHPLVGEARGAGLLGGIELVADKANKTPFDPPGKVGTYLFKAAHKHGLIVRNVVDTIAFCPPLVIDKGEIDEMFDRFARTLDETAQWAGSEGLLQ